LTNPVVQVRSSKVELAVFLSVTFVATFLLEVIGIARLGAGIFASAFPMSAMFIPAAVAIICMFCFRSAALTWQVKTFFAFYFISAAVAIIEMSYHPLLGAIGGYPILSTSTAITGFLLVVAFNLKRIWRRNLESARMSVGHNPLYYLIIPVFAAVYIAGMYLSNLFGLSAPAVEFSFGGFFGALGVAFAGLVFSWPVYFGEEYGWRYYLQDRLFPLAGKYWGVMALGVIWGLWHLPLMVMGLNFPGDPAIPANLVYLVYTIAMSVVFGYTVLKTGSVLIAVVLHGLTDMTVNAGRSYLATTNSIVAFLPLGIMMLIFALVLLRSDAWSKKV
jgi:membrane protease YdiL (CAAX protease family)